MLYDLRGYHDLSAEELAAIFRNNQEPSGQVGGYAHWGVYTPSMIFAVAQQPADRRPICTRCTVSSNPARSGLVSRSGEAGRAKPRTGPHGLMLAPLNDLTKDSRAWAFNQAYLFAGLDRLSVVLTEIRHPRAGSAVRPRKRSEMPSRLGSRLPRRVSGCSTARSHVESVRTCDALTPRRLMEIWYPTDVDTGGAFVCLGSRHSNLLGH